MKRWLPLLLLAACDCSPESGASDEVLAEEDILWDEVGREVGAEVPTPGPPPTFRPLTERETRDLEATPRVLFDAEYASVVLGDPPLAVRRHSTTEEADPVYWSTLVAIEESGARDLVTVRGFSADVIRDGDHAYLVADGLHRVSIAEGTSVQLESEPVRAVVVDGTHAYYVTGGGAILGDPPSTLHRIPKAGGEPEVLYRDLPFINAMVLHGERLHWAAKMRPRRLMDLPPGYFASAPADGSAPPEQQTFESQRPTHVVVDDAAVYILTEGTMGRSLTSSFNDGLVLRRDHGTTEWVTLADRQPMPESLVQDETHLCWAVSADAGFSIRCVAKTGGPITNVTGPTNDRPALDLRDGRLAWTERVGGRVMAVELASP